MPQPTPTAPLVHPADAYAQTGQGAVLVDVRTPEEWAYVGLPEVRDGTVYRISWQDAGGTRNAGFLDELRRAGVPTDAPVHFLCRSGARSQQAADAALAAGWNQAHNVADGFEGPVDTDGHRGTVAGWKAQGLPWRQS